MSMHLYLCDGNRAQPARIAEHNGDWSDVPILWSILLADASVCSTLNGGDADARCIRIKSARDRLTFFIKRIEEHPLLHRIPELVVYLEAIDSYLNSLQRRFPFFSRSGVLLIAQYEGKADELQDAHFMPTEIWAALHKVLDRREWPRLDDALEFTAYRHGFTKWYAWCTHFGFETLEHAYFNRLKYPSYASHYLPPPEAIAFDAFDKNKHTAALAYESQAAADDEDADDESNSESATDDSDDARYQRWYENYYLHLVGDKVGMVHMTSDDSVETILAAEWDHIQAVWDCWDYLWVRRDDQWGVVHVAHPCEILIAPCVDAIHPAYIRNPMIVEKAGRFGVIDAIEGRWLLPAEYDEVQWHRSEMHSVLRMRRGNLWGLLNNEGAIVQPCRFDELDNDRSFLRASEHGWRAVLKGKVGWLTNDGKTQLDCEWDDVKVFGVAGLYGVRKNKLWGLIAFDESNTGSQWLPCEYEEVQPLSLSHIAPPIPDPLYQSTGENTWPEENIRKHIAECAANQANVLIRVRRGGRAGLVDQANRTLIPFEYENVELIECGGFPDPSWMRITRNGKQGLWSMVEQREVFPCEHISLEMLTWPKLPRPVVITFDAIEDTANYSCRLWFTDRTSAVDGSFRWISSNAYDGSNDQYLGIGKYELGEIAQVLVEGQWLRASSITSNEIVHIRPGRPIVKEITSLQLEYRRNKNLNSALNIARRYHEGSGVEKDIDAAFEWANRACGSEFESETPPWEAAHFLATLLYEGPEQRRDPKLARHWAERAIKLCDHPTSPPSQVGLLLARLLLDEKAGTPDRERAVELLIAIDAPSLDEGEACYLLARCCRDGVGIDIDMDSAHEQFVRAVACGVKSAATELAALLREQANNAKGKDAKLLQREAEYYESVSI